MSKKGFKFLAIALLLIGALIAIYTWVVTSGESAAALKDPANSAKVYPIFIWSAILFGLSILGAIILPIPSILGNKKTLRNVLIALVCVVLWVILFFSLDSVNVVLFTVYILLALAVIAIIWSTVKGFVAK